jgi:hypothetical protein
LKDFGFFKRIFCHHFCFGGNFSHFEDKKNWNFVFLYCKLKKSWKFLGKIWKIFETKKMKIKIKIKIALHLPGLKIGINQLRAKIWMQITSN